MGVVILFLSFHPSMWEDPMSDGIQNLQQVSPPITYEDLSNLEAEPGPIDIPFIVSRAQLVQQLPGDERRLTQAEAEKLIEMLDRVTSSDKADPDLKHRCFGVLRQVSPTYRILPTSYHVAGIKLDERRPHVSGGFADIWKVRVGDDELSVKGFRVQKSEDLDKVKRRFYREIIEWKRVRHQNLVSFLGVKELLFSLCIINRSLPNGNIKDYIRRNENVNRLELLVQTACGVKYLHSLNIVHGDINPGNIQIDGDGIACLENFGIVAAINDLSDAVSGSMTMSESRTSVCYVAPEQINPESSEYSPTKNNPTKASDVYSFGMTIYEVLTGILPYGGTQDAMLVVRIVGGERPPRPQNAPWLRDEIWMMIEDCWNANREKRWNIDDVHEKLSAPSPGDITGGEREVGTAIPISSFIEHPPPPSSPSPSPPPSSPPHSSPKKTDVSPSPTLPTINCDPEQLDNGPQPRGWSRKIPDVLKRIFGSKRKYRNEHPSN